MMASLFHVDLAATELTSRSRDVLEKVQHEKGHPKVAHSAKLISLGTDAKRGDTAIPGSLTAGLGPCPERAS
nr:hypothetical protein BN993_02895 [Virgibacillus halodenitrificans]